MVAGVGDVYKQYADALGRDPQSLTDDEKKQAFMDAVMAGERIEPFATISDMIDAQMEVERKAAKIISDILEAKQSNLE